MGKRWWVVLGWLCCAGVAIAAGPGAVRKQVESSLLVKGTVDISADGAVLGYRLEKQEELPEGIVALMARSLPAWRFEPVSLRDGTTRARADMSVRIVARKLDSDNFHVQIRGAHFGQHSPGEVVSGDRMQPPRYPLALVRAGVTGTVYLAVKIGRDGKVQDVIAEQVNLAVIASESVMGQWRGLLSQAAVRAARDWTFNPPVHGDQVEASFWTARVPVSFRLAEPGQHLEHGREQEHKWHAYVPGPRQRIPWEPAGSRAGTDALVAGGVYPVGGGPRLLTALEPG